MTNPTSQLQCIHRSGCVYVTVCHQVGRCTSVQQRCTCREYAPGVPGVNLPCAVHGWQAVNPSGALTLNECSCPNGSYSKKHTNECYEAKIERLLKTLAMQNPIPCLCADNWCHDEVHGPHPTIYCKRSRPARKVLTSNEQWGGVEKLAQQRNDALAENEQLRAAVQEWLCEACNTVYPGPPQPGFACVQCPKCKGRTGPRQTIELRQLRAALERYKTWHAGGRSNVEFFDGGVRICQGDHDKHEPCEWTEYTSAQETAVPSPRFAGLIGEVRAPKAGDKCGHCGREWLPAPYGGQGVYHECHTGPSREIDACAGLSEETSGNQAGAAPSQEAVFEAPSAGGSLPNTPANSPGKSLTHYWLCCGETEYNKHPQSCVEMKSGHRERCRYGTYAEHSAWQLSQNGKGDGQ